MNIEFSQLLFVLLTFFPFYYKYSFWLYLIQLKEYRLDRFKEYIFTPQGKSALFNFWFFIEMPLLLGSLSIFHKSAFEIMIFPIIFYFLVFYNIFVIGKLVRKNFLRPKITGRLLLIVSGIVIPLMAGVYFILFQEYWLGLYSSVLALLIFAPFWIFLIIFLSSPLTSYLKNRKLKAASSKSTSKKINKVVKIGVTGSYGKSSIKEFLSSILEQDGELLKTPENINTELGVSDIILRKLDNSYKYFVAEMGAYKIGEISTLGKIVNHEYGFLTAIGNQHLALFGGIENTKKAKCEIAESVLKNDGILYINWNNENIRDAFNYPNLDLFPFSQRERGGNIGKKLNFIKYGDVEGSDAYYSNIQIKDSNTQFDFIYSPHPNPLLEERGQKVIQDTFEIPLIGEHHVLNITGVIACCIDLGLETSDIKKYLKNLQIPKNTLEITRIPHPGGTPFGKGRSELILIDDTYNLSEAGLIAGLGVLNTIASPHLTSPEGEEIIKILVMDDILELGKTAGKIHYKLGQKLATEKDIDKILFCGVNYRKDFVKGLIEGGFEESSILKSLDGIGEESVVLFEGRKARGYLEKIKNK